MKWLKRLMVLVIAVALVGFGGAWLMGRGKDEGSTFRTDTVTRGEVVSTISSSGVVQAEARREAAGRPR